MINRVLIRIKVVQMLYSYLLSRSEFKINDAPDSTSLDKRYQYRVYIDMMLLLLELSGYSAQNGKEAPNIAIPKNLKSNAVAKILNSHDVIRRAILKESSLVGVLDPLLQSIANKIEDSKVYIDYSKKKKRDLSDDVMLWATVFETIIGRDDEVIEALRSHGGFTVNGFKNGISDVCETLRNCADTKLMLLKAKKDLATSLDKAYELYIMLFSLIIDITDEQERRIEAARTKHLASADDLNPNMKLVNNKLVEYLRNSESFGELLKEYKVSPQEPGSLLCRSLLDQILQSELYAEYIKTPGNDLNQDTEFWRNVMRNIVFPSDALAEELEDASVYWNDDLQIMGTFVLKTLRQIAQSEGGKVEMLPKYMDEDDEKFGPELFMYAVTNQELYREYIDKFIQKSHWDPDRLAFMDIVIMTTAIAEIINFPSIPVAVSVNEYVEITNGYSTEKSGGFINGILYSVTKWLREQNIIFKD